MPKSTKTKKRRPELGRHKTGRWYKYYKGRFYYFYRWKGGDDAEDPDGVYSLDKWRHDKEFIDRGKEPIDYDPLDASGGTTVKDVCNYWLRTKKDLLEAGELQASTLEEYKYTAQLLLEILGHKLPAKLCGPERFSKVRLSLSKRFNANGLGKRIVQIRSIFTTAYEDRILEELPNFGRDFRKPKASAYRKLRNEKGIQRFTPDEFLTLFKHANINMRGMMLLGLQAGFGNEECAALPRDAIKDGWINWARVKTAVPRSVPLWPETAKVLAQCIEHANSKGEESLVFISARGKNFISERKNGYRVTGDFEATKRRAKRDSKLETVRTFYDLRRTFETVAGDTKDQIAVDVIMGHTPSESNMAARYRQEISEQRLEAVVEHVRSWLGDLIIEA